MLKSIVTAVQLILSNSSPPTSALKLYHQISGWQLWLWGSQSNSECWAMLPANENCLFSLDLETSGFCRAQVQVKIPGQVQARWGSRRSKIDLSLTLFLVFTHPPTTTTLHQELFSWLLRGLDMSDGPRMGWYDSSRVWGGQDFQVDAKAEIKWDYRGDIREYFNESKIVW